MIKWKFQFVLNNQFTADDFARLLEDTIILDK